MVYIPGPGSKNGPDSIKKSKIDNEKSEETKEIRAPRVKKKKEKKKKTPLVSTDNSTITVQRTRVKIPFVVYLLVFLAVFFSVAAFLKMLETEKAISERLDLMSSKYNNWYQEIKKQSDQTNELLKPNGWLNQSVLSSNLIKDYIIGIDDIINIAQKNDFSDLAFCRIFVSGNSPVWISIEGNSKTLFAKNISPGLSKETFYYYKQPKIVIDDKTIIIPKDFKITSGNFENTYILFFNFGATKMAKMNAQKISNVPASFSIWLPK